MNPHSSLADNVAAALGLNPQAVAASTTVTGAAIDMQGWDGVLFTLQKGAGDKTTDAKIQRDDNSGFSSATDISGAAITQIAGGTTNLAVGIDVLRPAERYVRISVTTGAGGATSNQVAAMAFRYRREGGPITQPLTELIRVKETA